MQQQRTGARGNYCAFSLPWADIFSEMGKQVSLPRTGEDLRRVVQVVLLGGDKVNPHVLSQATVRKEIVVQLIQEMIDKGHPAYRDYDMEQVRLNAEGLPSEQAVPPEIMAVLTTKIDIDKRRAGKPAAPPDSLTPLDPDDEDQYTDPWAARAASCVSMDGSCDLGRFS